MKIKFLLLLLISAISIISCVKEGPEGPQGPAGPQGPQGVQGPKGEQGNANVKRFSYNIPLNDFTKWSTTNEFWVYRTVNTTIGQNDAVLVFVYEDLAGSAEWIALPMMSYWNTGNCFNFFNYSTTTNNRVQFTIRNSCGGNPYSNMNSGSLSYRVFVIAGMAGRIIIDDIDITNYQEVCEAFGFEPN